MSSEDDDCKGHPSGPYDQMGTEVFCDGSCRGKHRYRITYRNEDPGSPVFSYTVRAWNMEHAVHLWEESDNDGWELVSIERIKP